MTDVNTTIVEAPAEPESGQGLAKEPEGAHNDLNEGKDAGDVAGTETDKDADPDGGEA